MNIFNLIKQEYYTFFNLTNVFSFLFASVFSRLNTCNDLLNQTNNYNILNIGNLIIRLSHLSILGGVNKKYGRN